MIELFSETGPSFAEGRISTGSKSDACEPEELAGTDPSLEARRSAWHDRRRVATFVAEPLERGFGTTLGNALRRILLSSLQGAAVVSVHIDGVLHEFSSIAGVREDVTDMILNIKEIAISMQSEGPKRLMLRKEGQALCAPEISRRPATSISSIPSMSSARWTKVRKSVSNSRSIPARAMSLLNATVRKMRRSA